MRLQSRISRLTAAQRKPSCAFSRVIWPFVEAYRRSNKPAAVKRVPANSRGGTASMPALVPIQVLPQMEHSMKKRS